MYIALYFKNKCRLIFMLLMTIFYNINLLVALLIILNFTLFYIMANIIILYNY